MTLAPDQSEKSKRFVRWVAGDCDEAPLSLSELGELAEAYAQASFERIDGASREASLACRRGCDWCCYLPVECSLAEAATALQYARARLDVEAFAVLKDRIADAAARPASRSGPLADNPPCPFLDRGRCLVYSARPLACRGWNSRDAGACESAFREGGDSVRIPVDSRLRGVFANASEALNRALLRDGRGEPMGLAPALAALLAAGD